jgi:hypothetical protein
VLVLDKCARRIALLPPHYAAVGTSGLSTTLKPGPNTFDLDLE